MVPFWHLPRLLSGAVFLAPRAIGAFTPVYDRLWRGRHGKKENPNSARGRFHMLRLADAPPHPDLLPARGEKETAVRRGQVRDKR